MVRLRLLLLIAFTLAACAPRASDPAVIRLSDLRPLPVTEAVGALPLRVAVAAVISPKGTAENYEPLMDYLSAKLGRPVEMIQRRTYAEINDLVESGQADVAFVCTTAYVAGQEEFGMELLAAPQVDGATVYYSVLIVPANSTVRGMADLRGKAFAFTDPMSTTGRMYPTLLVKRLGSTPDQFFGHTFFTYSHDDAIRAVAEGLADGAAVDSLVLDFAVRRDPALADRIQIIHRSPPFGIPPVVVGPGIRPQAKAELQAVLLGMADDAQGRAALEQIGVDRFVAIDDTAYDSVRELLGAVGPVK